MKPLDLLQHLIVELRRRKVFGVAAAYAVVAWGVIEVSGTILQMASAPAWISKAVLAVVAAGFPVALILAWFFDLSASGLVRTTAMVRDDRPAGATRRAQMLTAGVILGAFVLVATFAVWLRPVVNEKVEFTQLTSFADAATAPALSPDGRSLAFLKGRGAFGTAATPSEVYIKQLPTDEAIRLTNSSSVKATPAFSPDGSHVTFTTADQNYHWNTRVVSVHGGDESELLPNASGLTWLDDNHVMFSEVREGIYMGVRRSTLSREDAHDVYWPASDLGMAHRSAVSPDGRWVLVAEMDGGVWQPCRIVPFNGASRGRVVGPLDAQCTQAVWSPDGRWMYFSSDASGFFHIWRQRFPKGVAEQITTGPTEEEGMAMAPDGRSLITSAGVRHNSVWVVEHGAERPVTVEEYAFSPLASRDGARVYFLSGGETTQHRYNVGSLVVTTLSTGAREQLLPGHEIVHFDLSADDRTVAFVSGSDAADHRGIWVASLDRRSPPRRIFAGKTNRVFFDAAANIYFLYKDGTQLFLHRLRAPDYAHSERVYNGPVLLLFSVSPDGEWVAVALPREGREGAQQVAISTHGMPARVICSFCGSGFSVARLGAPPVSWSRDGRGLFVVARSGAGMIGRVYTISVPVRPGAALPQRPAGGINSPRDYLKVAGAQLLTKPIVMPGAVPDQIFFYESTTIRNLYRVRLPE